MSEPFFLPVRLTLVFCFLFEGILNFFFFLALVGLFDADLLFLERTTRTEASDSSPDSFKSESDDDPSVDPPASSTSSLSEGAPRFREGPGRLMDRRLSEPVRIMGPGLTGVKTQLERRRRVDPAG